MANSKPKVLVVDDDSALRNAIAFDFKRKGYEVLTAENGVEAFNIIKTSDIGVVISDMRMPGGDGAELLDRIRQSYRQIPVVIFITGYSDMSPEEAYDRGANAVFSKPFDRKALFDAVEKATTEVRKTWAVRPERVPTESSVSIQLKFGTLESALQASVLNIGTGGIFVAMTPPPPKQGDEVSFALAFQSETALTVSGTGIVRWVRAEAMENRPAGCGIEFISLSDECRAKVLEIVGALKAKAYIPKA